MNERMLSVFAVALAVIGVAVLSGKAEANWRLASLHTCHPRAESLKGGA